MKKNLGYSFDDEVANRFCYHMDNKKIEIYFGGYYDALNNRNIEKPCVWIIENWSDAKSKLNSEKSYHSLDTHLGIISMVLSLEIRDDNLELTVNTVDDRYVDLLFIDPQLKLL